MIPKATPQTATWKTRSQSPPRRVQRIPVSTVAATMASSSISPYAWIESGPRSISPRDGDGMLRIGIRGILAAAIRRSEQDLQRQLGRAAVLDQLDRPVEVDVVPGRESGGRGGRVARALELGGAPALHPLQLVPVTDVGGAHVVSVCLALHSLKRTDWIESSPASG